MFFSLEYIRRESQKPGPEARPRRVLRRHLPARARGRRDGARVAELPGHFLGLDHTARSNFTFF